MLQELGDRIVISHLDLIAYSNPGYFPDFERWEAYRQITRRALALADRIVFISREAAADALRNDLVDAERASVVYPEPTTGCRRFDQLPSSRVISIPSPIPFCSSSAPITVTRIGSSLSGLWTSCAACMAGGAP